LSHLGRWKGPCLRLELVNEVVFDISGNNREMVEDRRFAIKRYSIVDNFGDPSSLEVGTKGHEC